MNFIDWVHLETAYLAKKFFFLAESTVDKAKITVDKAKI